MRLGKNNPVFPKTRIGHELDTCCGRKEWRLLLIVKSALVALLIKHANSTGNCEENRKKSEL